MNTMPNLFLMLSFPLICLGMGAALDFALAVVRRRKADSFPGGANRFYWAVMIASLLRSAIFSLFFVPALALEGAVVSAYHMSHLELSVAMVLPALFGAYFATRLERHVFEVLESGLLRDRARFLASVSPR
jgi:hypothetical protein